MSDANILEEEKDSDFGLVSAIFAGIGVYVVALLAFSYLMSNSGSRVENQTATDKIFLLMSQVKPAKGPSTFAFSAYDQITGSFKPRFQKASWINRIPSSDHVAVSPDGTRIVACLKDEYQLIIADVRNGNIITSKSIKCEHPSFGANNELIYVQRCAEVGWKIIVEKNNVNIKEFESVEKVYAPQYFENSKKLFYFKDVSESQQQQIVCNTESENQTFKTFDTKIKAMALSPNGEKIAVSTADEPIEILSTKSGKSIWSLTDVSPLKLIWSTDNEHIYYLQEEAGGKDKDIRRVDTSEPSAEGEKLGSVDKNVIAIWRSY